MVTLIVSIIIALVFFGIGILFGTFYITQEAIFVKMSLEEQLEKLFEDFNFNEDELKSIYYYYHQVDDWIQLPGNWQVSANSEEIKVLLSSENANLELYNHFEYWSGGYETSCILAYNKVNDNIVFFPTELIPDNGQYLMKKYANFKRI